MTAHISPFFRRALAVTAFVSLLFSGTPQALAATFTNPSVTLSDRNVEATGVSYTINFTSATTDTLKRIEFQFGTTLGGSTKPANLSLTGSSLDSTSGIGSGWTYDTSSASSGLVFIENTSTPSVASSSAVQVVLDGITNPTLADCDVATQTLTDTCYVRIISYSDDGVTEVDSANTYFGIKEDPFLSFEVEGTLTGETHNGVTTNADSSPTTMMVGHLRAGVVRYMAHKLTIATNAPHGYTIRVRLANELEGVSYPSNYFSPFGAVNAAWSTPQLWDTPDGISPNSNTGWIGANTSDTRVSGWASASGKFGPISTNGQIVAQSTGPDEAGSIIYVSFAMEVNELHPSGTYQGSISYEVEGIY